MPTPTASIRAGNSLTTGVVFRVKREPEVTTPLPKKCAPR